jgi:hypothetical protein
MFEENIRRILESPRTGDMEGEAAGSAVEIWISRQDPLHHVYIINTNTDLKEVVALAVQNCEDILILK